MGSRHRILAVIAAATALSAHALRPGPPAVARGTFGPPVVVSDIDTGEPGIDVAPDGTLYVNALTGLLRDSPFAASHLWRSDDGGASWSLTPPGARGLLPGGGDSDVAVAPDDGTVHMTDLWLGSATVSVSDDRGESWLSNPLQGVVVQDRPWIAAAGGGRVYHVANQVPVGLVVSKSVDGGLTYPFHAVAATSVVDRTGCVCPPGTLVVEGGGGHLGLEDRVGVIYATSTSGMRFARSTTGGLLFSSSVVSDDPGVNTARAFPVVANAGGDHLVAVWQEVGPAGSVVRFNDSRDWGATWGSPRTIVASGTSVFPWVDARGNKVAVSLYHTAAPGDPTNVAEDAAWHEAYLESLDAGATFSPLVVADPTPVKTGPICTEGVGCEDDRELLDYQTVALDHAGRANVAYTRSVDGEADTQIRFARQSSPA